MSELDNRYDRLILWIVKHVPVRLIVALAAVSYLGCGFALPLALKWSALWLVSANLWGIGRCCSITPCTAGGSVASRRVVLGSGIWTRTPVGRSRSSQSNSSLVDPTGPYDSVARLS